MKPIKGISLDSTPLETEEGHYRFGKNGIQYDLKGTIVNEPGFKRLQSLCPSGWRINGLLEADSGKVVVFSTDNINSSIQLVDLTSNIIEFSWNDINVGYFLGFNIEYYITGEVQRNYKNELIVAFTDKRTFPKFLNLSNPDTTKLGSWSLFPNFILPTITMTSSAAGYYKEGSYYTALRYYKKDGTSTPYSSVYGGCIINTEDVAGLNFKLENVDTSYQYLELVVIAKTKGVTACYVLPKQLIGTSTMNVVSDSPDGDSIDITEVLVGQVRYSKVGTMTQLNDALYVGNLTREDDLLDMQQYANLIIPEWTSELKDVSDQEELSSGAKKTFKHREVYALYVKYLRANGTKTIAFTIPGVAGTAANYLTSTVGTTGGVTRPTFQVEDTITTFSSTNKIGRLGVHENQNETYPNTPNFNSVALGGLDLRGKKVRHHKMPSIGWCKENLYSSETSYGTSKLDVLGIRLTNIQIPLKYQGDIIGYELFYAKRTISNMSVYAQSVLIQGATNTVKDPLRTFSTGCNITRTGSGVNDWQITWNKFRFLSPDLNIFHPTIEPNFIARELNLNGKVEQKYVKWTFSNPGTVASGKPCNVYMVDCTKSITTATLFPSAYKISGVDKAKWIKNHSITTETNNVYVEEALIGNLLGTTPPSLVATTVGSDITIPNLTTNQLSFTELCEVKDDMYKEYYNQNLVSAGGHKYIGNTDAFFGGDCFLGPYTFHTHGVKQDYDVPTDDGSGADRPTSYPYMKTERFVYRLLCESVVNTWSLFEQNSPQGKFYPKSQIETSSSPVFPGSYPAFWDATLDPNKFGYYKGAEGINDLVAQDIYSPLREYITEFPHRIARGGKLSRQNTRSWRTFLAADYYDCQKDRGPIINLSAISDSLLIHHLHALFLTRDKVKLETGLLGVTLGSGDIFQFEPQEAIQSNLGYGGTQSDLCCVDTPIGYVFPDAKVGEMYIFSDKKLSAINGDIGRFLNEYLKVRGVNSFNSNNSITIGWDQVYKRLFVSVKNLEPTSPIRGIPFSSDSIESVQTLILNGQPVSNSLVMGNGQFVYPEDIVFMDGKYLKYKGLNPTNSPDQCEPTPVTCNPVLSLTGSWIGPNDYHVSWSFSAFSTFQYTLWKLENLGGTLTRVPVTINGVLISGVTTGTFLDFHLTEQAYYELEVQRVCEPGTDQQIYSNPSIIQFSLNVSEPAVVSVPTPGTRIDTYVITREMPALYRVRTNGGPWSVISSGFGPLPRLQHIYANLPGNNATIEVEFGMQIGNISFVARTCSSSIASCETDPITSGVVGTVLFPGDAGYSMTGQYGVEGLATQASDTSNILTVTNPLTDVPAPYNSIATLTDHNITAFTPDPNTAYSGINKNGQPIVSYYRWTLQNKGWFYGNGILGTTPYTKLSAQQLPGGFAGAGDDHGILLLGYKPI